MDTAYEHGAVSAACHTWWCQYAATASLHLFQGAAVAHGVKVQVAGTLASGSHNDNNNFNTNTNYDKERRKRKLKQAPKTKLN